MEEKRLLIVKLVDKLCNKYNLSRDEIEEMFIQELNWYFM